ncbi:MAG: MFS transporter [Treponema sp.]|nr:MFS transporter [Treponema sp.]
MALVESRFRRLYAVLFSIFVLFGISMTIIGATLPKILTDFGWSYTSAGAVIAAGAVSYFAATYGAGFLISAIGAKPTMLIGLVLEVLGLLFFAKSPSVLINLLLNTGIGVGQGFLELTVNWSTLRMEKSSHGRAMNLMHGAFAAGAFIGPFVIGILMQQHLSWTLVYRLIAVLFAGIFVLITSLSFSSLGKDPGHNTTSGRRDLLKHPAYWLGFFTLLLYVGVELGISNWIAEYFVVTYKASPASGSFMVSLFWVGLLAGRFGVPLLYRGNRQGFVLVFMSLLMSLSVILLSALGFAAPNGLTLHLARGLAFLAGLGCSIIYPMVVTRIGAAFPDTQSEAVAFSTMGGGVGAFAFPFLMAALSSAFGIRLGFASYGLFSLAVVASNITLVRLTLGK